LDESVLNSELQQSAQHGTFDVLAIGASDHFGREPGDKFAFGHEHVALNQAKPKCHLQGSQSVLFGNDVEAVDDRRGRPRGCGRIALQR
jgi:hypothetical protein